VIIVEKAFVASESIYTKLRDTADKQYLEIAAKAVYCVRNQTTLLFSGVFWGHSAMATLLASHT